MSNLKTSAKKNTKNFAAAPGGGSNIDMEFAAPRIPPEIRAQAKGKPGAKWTNPDNNRTYILSSSGRWTRDGGGSSGGGAPKAPAPAPAAPAAAKAPRAPKAPKKAKPPAPESGNSWDKELEGGRQRAKDLVAKHKKPAPTPPQTPEDAAIEKHGSSRLKKLYADAKATGDKNKVAKLLDVSAAMNPELQKALKKKAPAETSFRPDTVGSGATKNPSGKKWGKAKPLAQSTDKAPARPPLGFNKARKAAEAASKQSDQRADATLGKAGGAPAPRPKSKDEAAEFLLSGGFKSADEILEAIDQLDLDDVDNLDKRAEEATNSLRGSEEILGDLDQIEAKSKAALNDIRSRFKSATTTEEKNKLLGELDRIEEESNAALGRLKEEFRVSKTTPESPQEPEETIEEILDQDFQSPEELIEALNQLGIDARKTREDTEKTLGQDIPNMPEGWEPRDPTVDDNTDGVYDPDKDSGSPAYKGKPTPEKNKYDDMSLEDLFLESDRVGNKYQTLEDRQNHQKEMSKVNEQISDDADRLIPDDSSGDAQEASAAATPEAQSLGAGAKPGSIYGGIDDPLKKRIKNPSPKKETLGANKPMENATPKRKSIKDLMAKAGVKEEAPEVLAPDEDDEGDAPGIEREVPIPEDDDEQIGVQNPANIDSVKSGGAPAAKPPTAPESTKVTPLKRNDPEEKGLAKKPKEAKAPAAPKLSAAQSKLLEYMTDHMNNHSGNGVRDKDIPARAKRSFAILQQKGVITKGPNGKWYPKGMAPEAPPQESTPPEASFDNPQDVDDFVNKYARRHYDAADAFKELSPEQQQQALSQLEAKVKKQQELFNREVSRHGNNSKVKNSPIAMALNGMKSTLETLQKESPPAPQEKSVSTPEGWTPSDGLTAPAKKEAPKSDPEADAAAAAAGSDLDPNVPEPEEPDDEYDSEDDTETNGLDVPEGWSAPPKKPAAASPAPQPEEFNLELAKEELADLRQDRPAPGSADYKRMMELSKKIKVSK